MWPAVHPGIIQKYIVFYLKHQQKNKKVHIKTKFKKVFLKPMLYNITKKSRCTANWMSKRPRNDPIV